MKRISQNKAWQVLLLIVCLISGCQEVRAQGVLNVNELDDSTKFYLNGVRVTHVEFISMDETDIDSFAIRSDKEGDTSIIVTTFHPKERGSVIYIVNDIEVSKGIRDKIQADDIASDSVKKEGGRETHLITTKSGRVLKEQ